MNIGDLAAIVAVIGSAVGIYLSLSRSRPERRGIEADAAETGAKAITLYAEENIRLKTELRADESELTLMRQDIATMQKQIADLQNAVIRLEAQVVSLGGEPVTRKAPRSAE